MSRHLAGWPCTGIAETDAEAVRKMLRRPHRLPATRDGRNMGIRTVLSCGFAPDRAPGNKADSGPALDHESARSAPDPVHCPCSIVAQRA